MTARLRLWWQQMKQHPVAIGVVVVLLLILFILLAYRFSWDWTGLNSGTSQITITSTSKVNYTATISQPSKSLWDWLQLLGVLAIPVVVALGAAWFTAQQGKVSDRENKDNQHEAALQAYIDKMSELLLEKHLLESKEDEEIRKIARIRTITVLKQLNAQRIGYVFTFLREAGLMTTTANDNVVRLNDADLRAVKWAHADLFEANLYWASLHHADLSRAYLRRACLSRAVLNKADLTGAYLNEANLSKAYLSGTILTGANLTEANFTGADLSNADLRGADLRGANFVDAILGGATLKGARYNREREEKLDALRRPIRDAMIEPTKWPEGFHPQTAGATVEGIDLSPYQF